MNTFIDGQTYTFTDFTGKSYSWTRTGGKWIDPTGVRSVRDDAMVAELLAVFPDSTTLSR